MKTYLDDLLTMLHPRNEAMLTEMKTESIGTSVRRSNCCAHACPRKEIPT